MRPASTCVRSAPPYPQRQRGVILIVCLLVIMVVTLIATTATRTSTFEEKMAATAQTMNRTFQAAESAVHAGLDNETLMFEALDASDRLSSTASVPFATEGVSATAQTRYVGQGIAPGNSLGTATTYKYEIRGEGRMDDFRASTLVRQGLYRVSFVTSTEQ